MAKAAHLAACVLSRFALTTVIGVLDGPAANRTAAFIMTQRNILCHDSPTMRGRTTGSDRAAWTALASEVTGWPSPW
jgi:hypothetical protein